MQANKVREVLAGSTSTGTRRVMLFVGPRDALMKKIAHISALPPAPSVCQALVNLLSCYRVCVRVCVRLSFPAGEMHLSINFTCTVTFCLFVYIMCVCRHVCLSLFLSVCSSLFFLLFPCSEMHPVRELSCLFSLLV